MCNNIYSICFLFFLFGLAILKLTCTEFFVSLWIG